MKMHGFLRGNTETILIGDHLVGRDIDVHGVAVALELRLAGDHLLPFRQSKAVTRTEHERNDYQHRNRLINFSLKHRNLPDLLKNFLNFLTNIPKKITADVFD